VALLGLEPATSEFLVWDPTTTAPSHSDSLLWLWQFDIELHCWNADIRVNRCHWLGHSSRRPRVVSTHSVVAVKSGLGFIKVCSRRTGRWCSTLMVTIHHLLWSYWALFVNCSVVLYVCNLYSENLSCVKRRLWVGLNVYIFYWLFKTVDKSHHSITINIQATCSWFSRYSSNVTLGEHFQFLI